MGSGRSRQTEPADTDLDLTPVEGEMDGTRIEEVESQNMAQFWDILALLMLSP